MRDENSLTPDREFNSKNWKNEYYNFKTWKPVNPDEDCDPLKNLV
jgi:hypothetical protein